MRWRSRPGAQVEVTIEADVSATRPRESSNGKEPRAEIDQTIG